MPLSVISLLTHAYIAWRLVPALAEFAWLQVGVALLVVLSAISLQVGLSHWRNRRQARRRGHDVAMMAAFVAMGFLSSLFVLTLLRDVALVGVWIASELGLAISHAVGNGRLGCEADQGHVLDISPVRVARLEPEFLELID